MEHLPREAKCSELRRAGIAQQAGASAGRSEGWSYGDGVGRNVLALCLEGCMERGGAFWMGYSGVCVWEARLKKEPFQLHGTGVGKNGAVNYYKYTPHVQQGEEVVKEERSRRFQWNFQS